MPAPQPSSPGTSAPPARKKCFAVLAGACGGFVLFDLALRLGGVDKHSAFRWEQWPGAHGVAGFAACLLLVTVARFLVRPLVKRDEDYYEPARSSLAGGKAGEKTGGKTDA